MTDNEVYLALKGARERLCRAQTFVPIQYKARLGVALTNIDLVGSDVCPEQWSRFDLPEPMEPR